MIFMDDYVCKYVYWFARRGKDGKVKDDIYISLIMDDSDLMKLDGHPNWSNADLRAVKVDPNGEFPKSGGNSILVHKTEGVVYNRRFWLNGYDYERAKTIVDNYLNEKKEKQAIVKIDYKKAFEKLVNQIEKERTWSYDDEVKKNHKWHEKYFKGMQDAYDSMADYAQKLKEGRIW